MSEKQIQLELCKKIDKLEKKNTLLVKALKRLVESSPCQNGCNVNDMTCDTMFAKQALKK